MNKFHIYSVGLVPTDGVTANQIREVLESNKKFNEVSIVEQERGLAMLVANQGRPDEILKLVDEAKKAVEVIYGRCFLYDQSVKKITF